jgi:oligoribonuclease NrnB/cAMP/cGMP phosphodiesterase (DHH superfamily)
MSLFQEYILNKKLPTVYVFYHANCYDGLTAAWLFTQFYPKDDVLLIPCEHGKPIPNIAETKNKHVFVVDFSFPLESVNYIKDRAASFQLLDHHIDGQINLGGQVNCFFDMNRSGAGLTFDYLNALFADRQIPRPLFIDYFEAMDLHNTEKLDVVTFGNYLKSFGKATIETIDHIVTTFNEAEMLRIGEQNSAIINNLVEGICSNHLILEIDGSKFFAVVGNKLYAHEIAMYLSQINHISFVGCCITITNEAVGLSFRCDSKHWNITADNLVGSTPKDFANKLGGGGHIMAAAAKITHEQFFELLNKRLFIK